jgi:arylsulfatase A-like enzyme
MNPESSVTVLLCDDHAVVRAGLRALLFKVDPAWWPTCRIAPEEALAQAARALAAEPGVVHVWTQAELGAKECAGYCRLYANSLAGERSGDLLVQLDPTCELSADDPDHEARDVTQHGTPYAYDRDVPRVFWGNGVRPGVVRGRAHTVDIAPTLAARLGVPPRSSWAGRALPLE